MLPVELRHPARDRSRGSDRSSFSLIATPGRWPCRSCPAFRRILMPFCATGERPDFEFDELRDCHVCVAES